jgi:hypothetical protein
VQHFQGWRVLGLCDVIYEPFDYFFTSYDAPHISERSDQSQDSYPQSFPYLATEFMPALSGVERGGIACAVGGGVLGSAGGNGALMAGIGEVNVRNVIFSLPKTICFHVFQDTDPLLWLRTAKPSQRP